MARDLGSGLGEPVEETVTTSVPGAHRDVRFVRAALSPVGGCRCPEIISPAGFEQYFAEMVALGGSTEADPQARAPLASRYGLEVDPQSVPDLVRRFDLVFPGEPV